MCFYKIFYLGCSWDFGLLAHDVWLKVFGLRCSLAFWLRTIGLRPKTFVLRVGTIGLGPKMVDLGPRTIALGPKTI